MKKNGSTKAKANVAKKTAMKMLSMPFCAYFVQISTTFLLSDAGFLDAFELDIGLDEFDGAIGAGGHGLCGSAGEPVDHGAAGDEAEDEGRMEEREVVDVFGETFRERHDDRENHRRCADDGRADKHRLGRSFEGVARAVVGFEHLLGPREVDDNVVVLLEFPLDARDLFD